MQNHWLKTFLLLICSFTVTISESYYSIIAPGIIKSNRKYSVVVALHEATGPCLIRVGIQGPDFKPTQDVEVQPFEKKLINFFPKKLLAGKYKLFAEGLSGIVFKNESVLFVNTYYGPYIYIQTDKAIYKPEDMLRFRFSILDEHSRPLYIDDPIHVEISDEKNNIFKQFKNITLTTGLFTGDFKFSKYPTLGYWQIKVTLGGNYNYSSSKYIQVKDYQLPKFSVFIKAPSDVVLEDGFIQVVLYGKYTFNKYVEGNATIKLYDTNENKPLAKMEIVIDKLTSVEFKIKDLENFETLYGVKLLVEITEKHTGKTESDKKYIKFHNQRYNIEIPQEQIDFNDGRPFRLTALVRHWTGAAVLDYKNPITMEHGGKVYQSLLGKNGEALFEFEHQLDAKHVFKFKDSKTILPNIYRNKNSMLNGTDYYCRLKLLNGNPQLGKPLRIEVSSIDYIPYLNYILMGHASLTRSMHIKVAPNQKSYTIEITPSIEMVPRSYIYVYYVHKGNLRYEEMAFSFPYELENQISIALPKQAKPGEEVTLKINAQPKSYVSILAVDLGVYLLDSSYDLYKKDVLHNLALEMSYISVPSSSYPGIVSGVITFTNAHYPYEIYQEYITPSPKVPNIPRFRQKFPETWIFQNFYINDTTTELTLPIPDTITTWRLTAFSNNDVTGFGIVNGPTDIIAMQSLFISLNLPYSVKRGEIVSLPITIFNYLNQTVDVDVVLYNDDQEFNFMESRLTGVERSADEQQQRKRINVALNKAETVNFLISPSKLGEISVKISASSALYTDNVLQKLKVVPEGTEKQKSQAQYISVPADEKISSTFHVEIPEDSVPDSEYITFSVGGHYLVPTIENFDDLIQMPTGCGEQNVINFAPSVLVLQYLEANGNLTYKHDLAKKLISSIDTGYQQQLSFRHSNGGFSVFGENTDEEASTWLTAYVLRYLIKASKYSDIEMKVIETGLEYLSKKQQPNGEFPYTGYLLKQNHMNPYGLTAFVLLAFLDDNKYALKYKEVIRNGVEFLDSNLENVNDIYALSILATVLKRAKSNGANTVLNQLKSYGREEDGLKWWSGNDVNPANDIEITAYTAMSLLETPGDHTSVLKWLIEQRNANGGFASSHDTVVGLEALVKFSEKYKNYKNINLKINYKALDGQGNDIKSGIFSLDSDNYYVLQMEELPATTRLVSFNVEGSGNCLVQIKHQYYSTETSEEFHHFNIKPKVTFNNSEEINLEVCFTYQYKSDQLESNATSMIIMETNLPSGYRSEAESSLDLKQNKLIQKIETKNLESTIIFYLNNLKADTNFCLNIPADKTNEILMPKPASIVMYDYYNLSRLDTKLYSL